MVQTVQLGGAAISFQADSTNLTRGTRRANQSLQRHRRELRVTQQRYQQFSAVARTSVARLGGLGAALGVGFAGAGIATAIRNATQFGASLVEMATSIGGSVEELQNLRFVAESDGIAINQLDKSLQRLNRNIGEALIGSSARLVEGFKEIGLSAQELSDLSLEERFLAMADALRNIEDPTRRAATAYLFFGKSGQDLIPILIQSREEIEGTIARAEELVNVTDENARALKDAEQAFSEFSRTIENRFINAVGRSVLIWREFQAAREDFIRDQEQDRRQLEFDRSLARGPIRGIQRDPFAEATPLFDANTDAVDRANRAIEAYTQSTRVAANTVRSAVGIIRDFTFELDSQAEALAFVRDLNQARISVDQEQAQLSLEQIDQARRQTQQLRDQLQLQQLIGEERSRFIAVQEFETRINNERIAIERQLATATGEEAAVLQTRLEALQNYAFRFGPEVVQLLTEEKERYRELRGEIDAVNTAQQLRQSSAGLIDNITQENTRIQQQIQLLGLTGEARARVLAQQQFENSISRQLTSIRNRLATATGEEREQLEARLAAVQQYARTDGPRTIQLLTEELTKREQLTESLMNQQMAYMRAEELARTFAGSITQGLTGIAKGTQSVEDALLNLANNILSRVIEQLLTAQLEAFAFNTVLSAFSGSGGGGNRRGLLGSFGGLLGLQRGGTLPANRLAVVGEREPELLISGVASTVVPFSQLGGGGTNITYAPVIQQQDEAGTRRALQSTFPAFERTVRAGLTEDASQRSQFRTQIRR